MDKSTEHFVVERVDVEYVFLGNNDADVLKVLIFPDGDSVRNEFSVVKYSTVKKPEQIGKGWFKNGRLELTGEAPGKMKKNDFTDVLNKISEESQKAFTNRRNSLLQGSHIGFDGIHFVTIWFRGSRSRMDLESANTLKDLLFKGHPQMTTVYGTSPVGFYDSKILSDFVPSLDVNEILKGSNNV